MREELARALAWVELSDKIALENEGAPAEVKPDGTPVTAGDRAVEAFLRERIEREFPGDAIVGEEQGGGGGERCWVIDPIDGTKNYLARIPVYATLIAFETEGMTQVAVVSAPALRTRWWAVLGAGASMNGAPISVSSTSELSAASLCHGGTDWDAARTTALAAATARQRGFGDFWGHCLVAQGAMDLMYEPAPLARWDLAAPRLIVEEAGGRVTGPAGETAPKQGPVLSSNARLHEEALRVLAAAG